MIHYNETVLDHFNNPRNVGELEDADGESMVSSSRCGDMMQLFLKIENNVITDARFRTFGCSAAIASGSAATEMIVGKTLQRALRVTKGDIEDALGGLPVIKANCSVLAENAIRAAVEDYQKKRK